MRLGAVTIGQSPRIDVTPDLEGLLTGVTLVERGALDDLDPVALEALAAAPEGEVLATRLRDGSEIVVAERDVVPRLQGAIDALQEEGVEAVLVLCTGHFSGLSAAVPLLYPERTLQGLFGAAFAGGVAGVVTPDARQLGFQRERWSRRLGSDVAVVAASPYRGDWREALERAGNELGAAGATMVAMDCIGYSRAMRSVLAATLPVPILLARTTLARVAAEVLAL